MRLRVAAILLSLVVAGCADASSPGEGKSDGGDGWERLSDAPLAGRTSASIVGIGDQVYVVGGWPFLCPPNADCGPSEPPFADGAALDLRSGEWQAIADAPFGFTRGSTASVDNDIYVVTGCARSARCSDRPELLRYDTVGDAWTELGVVPKDVGTQLVSTDHGLLALAGSDEQGEQRDAVFDEASSTWEVLPDDPLPLSFDRFAVEDGDRLLVFGSPIAEPADEVRTKNVAAYDWATGTWTELPSAPAGGYQAWPAGDRVFLNPHFSKDGGGVLDLATDTWGAIPDEGSGWEGDAAGVVHDSGATYEYAAGWVFDARDDTWFEIPGRGGEVYDDTVAAVGRSLFVFGGQRWDGNDGELVAEAWVFEPPR